MQCPRSCIVIATVSAVQEAVSTTGRERGLVCTLGTFAEQV